MLSQAFFARDRVGTRSMDLQGCIAVDLFRRLVAPVGVNEW